MNRKVAKRIRKEIDSLNLDEKKSNHIYRKAKKLHNKNKLKPGIINFGKRYKNESLDDFRKRRKEVNKKKRLRRKPPIEDKK